MSIASPQNREELKAYIKTRLGAPVLQINVSDEQMDIAINDAFQYFNERQHYDATETVYLSTKVEAPFLQFVKTGEIEVVKQSDTQQRSAAGMVDTLTLVTPGSGYKHNTEGSGNVLTLETTGGNGSGLVIAPGDARTTTGGLVTATVDNTGTGYQVGDQVTVSGGNGDAVFQVATIKESSPLY